MKTNLNNESQGFALNDALFIYEQLRAQMPAATPKKDSVRNVRLTDILDNFDALFLDGYGVLNVGSHPVKPAYELLDTAKDRGIEIFLLTNGASKTSSATLEKYRNLGFNFEEDRLISSRDAMIDGLSHSREAINKLGIVDSFVDDIQLSGSSVTRLEPYALQQWMEVDEIGLLGSVNWDDDWQKGLELALEAGTTVHVANPDVASPQNNKFGKEPGYWAFTAAQKTGKLDALKWYGKPHRPIFDLALSRLKITSPGKNIRLDRVAMVGDTLHTDILGGQAAGIKTVLVTSYGLFKDGGFEEAVNSTGIKPDYIVETL